MSKIKVIVFAICLLILLRPDITYAASINPNFLLTVTNENPSVNTNINLVISADGLTDMYGYEMNLVYDSSALEFVSYTAGDGYTAGPIKTANGVLLVHTNIGLKSGINGKASLATVTFTALKSGESQIGLSSLKFVNSQLAYTEYNSSLPVAKIMVGGGITGGTGSTGGTGAVGPITPAEQLGHIKLRGNIDPVELSLVLTLDQDRLKQALDQVVANSQGIKKVSIENENGTDSKKFVQILPTIAISNNQKKAEIEIVTNVANVTIPDNMLQSGLTSSKEVALHIESLDNNQFGTKPAIDLILKSGDEIIPWKNINAAVSVDLPYKPTNQELVNPEFIVVKRVDANGNISPVPNSKYDPVTGNVTFKTTNLGIYAIEYQHKTFEDLQPVEWARNQVEVMASKGIINGVSENEFQPETAITRADFLSLLVRTLELDGEAGAEFQDVPQQAYYSNALRIARGLGIVEGDGDNNFRPLDSITREDMMVLTARALKVVNQLAVDSNQSVLNKFSDAKDISWYAADSISTLVRVGLIHGDDKGVYPKGTTTRAETAVLMYNIYNH